MADAAEEKMNIKKLLYFLFSFGTIPFVAAHCPLCTAAVGGAAITAQYFGLDTSIIGLLVGAFGISTGIWVANKIKKRYFRLQSAALVALSFFLTIIPLASAVKSEILYFPVLFAGDPGTVLNKVYWLSKFFMGTGIGAVASLAGYYMHKRIKRAYGSVLFPFQGVAITLALLAVFGVFLFFWGGA